MSFNLSQNSPSRKVHYKILSTQNINKDLSSSGNDICSRLENVKLSSQYFFLILLTVDKHKIHQVTIRILLLK